MNNNETFLLSLTRLGIGNYAYDYPQAIDWSVIQDLATEQGLLAVAMDGVEKLPVSLRPPQDQLLEWIGEVLQGYEYRYDQYCRTIAELAKFYNSHGIKMMVLKGYACSLTWPKPERRPCGDIDIWLFGEYKRADSLVASEKKIKVDTSHHNHTVFEWGDFTVENHYDFLNVHAHKTSKDLEIILKEMAQDSSHYTEVYGEKVYLPSPNLHALFLLRHMVGHFASEGITLRHVLDWAFHVRKYGKDIDWDWLRGVLDNFGLMPFYNCLNAICVEELGFNASMFKTIQFVPDMKEKILREILSPQFSREMPKYLVPRMLYKYKRWQASGWKREICYNESLSTSFWNGMLSHLKKPLSI